MRQKNATLQCILAATLALPATVATALSWQSPFDTLRKLPVAGRNVWMHPFNDDSAFGLYDHGMMSFDRAVAKSLHERMRNPFVEIRVENVSGLSLVAGSSSHDYRFFVGGVPLCGFQVRAHALASQKSGLVLGSIPEIDPAAASAAAHAEWADVDLAFDHAAAAAIADAGMDGAVMKHASRCLYVTSGGLLPVWRLELVAGGLPYTALSDAYELVSLQRSYFDVDGTAKVFNQNILTGPQANVALTGLVGDGNLTSEYLQIVVPDGRAPATEPTHVYNYKQTDPKFPQVQAYANVQRHFDYFKSLGFEWYGAAPLQVKLHVLPAGRKNNALFMPGGSDGSKPSISVHDGDGIELQNLATDADVVNHEFGHHVVYKTLQSTDGESLVLHEGLADFFAFARTGDACLGESICPEGNSVCVLETQCLRTGELELAYEDELWMKFAGPTYRLGHQHGMMISGMLWDIRKSGSVPAEDLSKLVFQAVQYFQADSGFRDLMLSLMIADSEHFGGKYNAAIRAAGDARGMAQFYSDVTPGAAIPSPEGGGSLLPGDGDEGTQSKKKKKDENPFSCGVAGGGNHDTATWALLALALLLPFMSVLKPAVARRRHRRPTERQR